MIKITDQSQAEQNLSFTFGVPSDNIKSKNEECVERIDDQI